nr:MAG TPA: hypothetical protein [Caudoviricetes sp.]
MRCIGAQVRDERGKAKTLNVSVEGFSMAPAAGLEPATVRLTVRKSDRMTLGTIGQNGFISTVSPYLRCT